MEHKKVSEISEVEAIEIIKELIKVFNIEVDEKKIEESVYMLQFLEERKKLCEIYKKNNFKTQNIIEDYKTSFKQLIDDINENPNNVAKIKANIAELMSRYKWVMDLYHRQLFWSLKEISPLAIMCLLMNDDARKYYLPIPVKKDDIVSDNGKEEKRLNKYVVAFPKEDNKKEDNLEVVYDIENNIDKRDMYNEICKMIRSRGFDSCLEENLHVFEGVTDGYWKDLETKGKKYMIISMESGDLIRSAGLQGGDMDINDVKNKFVIVDGIDYKSNSASHKLLYMEV